MTTKRVTMIKLKEILRLKYEAQLSLRQIALCLSLSIGVISKYLQRAEAAGLGCRFGRGTGQGPRPRHPASPNFSASLARKN